MTAEAKALVEKIRESEKYVRPFRNTPNWYGTLTLTHPELEMLCALAARGAALEGATEAWIDWNEAQDVGEGVCGTIFRERRRAIENSPEGQGPVRRVWIEPAPPREEPPNAQA